MREEEGWTLDELGFEDDEEIKPIYPQSKPTKPMSKAPRFLLDLKCGDLVLNHRSPLSPKEWIYASDAMEKYLEDYKQQLIKRIEQEAKHMKDATEYETSYGLERAIELIKQQ
jgi:hypothetical protein